jgi:solute carrier family 25 citrate transporter 1
VLTIQYPFEFIKTYRQLPAYKSVSTLTIIRSIYSSTGISGFYTGCPTLASSNALKASVRFLSFSSAQNYLRKPFERAGFGNAVVNVIAGLSAGVAESIAVVTPGECLKTRMIQDAAKGGRRLGMFGAIRDVVRSEGVFALWKGLMPVLCKQGTNSAVRFACFASLKEQVAKRWPGKEKMVVVTLGIGGVSGIATVQVWNGPFRQ